MLLAGFLTFFLYRKQHKKKMELKKDL